MKNVRILVPIDFSKLSFKALEAAEEFAKFFDGAITPFHSYLSLPDSDVSGRTTGDKLADTQEELEKKLLTRLEEHCSKYIDSKYLNPGLIKIGNASDTIIEAATDFDLIVMTTHGRTGFSRLIMGSVAEKVIRFAPVPVVVVEEASVLKPLEKILLTTDFSDYSLKAIPYAKEIAEKTGASIDILHIISFEQFGSIPQVQVAIDTKKKQLKELVNEHFSDMKDKVNTEVATTEFSIHEKITKRAIKRGYNLVVMATIGRTGLKYLRLGSTASNIVRHVENAVFTINPRRLKDLPEDVHSPKSK
ncbi:universal stress protein [Balneolaceae bacterium ANBcel3]|nr:universal stress protein [Balneolaceae bacterium ANBcel3]